MSVVSSAVGSWMRQAGCASDPGLAWTQERWRVARADVEMIAAVCDACPVAAQCREFVVATVPTAGFWAGAFRERWQVDTTAPLFLADMTDVADDQVLEQDMQSGLDDPSMQEAGTDALHAVRRARRRDVAVARRREAAEHRRQARGEAQQRAREELEAMPVAGLRRIGGGYR